jgi:hypothetical protein
VSDASPASTLSHEASARVVALSCTLAGGVLFLYVVDQLAFGWFDPFYIFMRVLMESDPRYSALRKYASLALLGIWGVSWLLAGLDSIRSPGSRRLAVASVAILIFGIILALMMNADVRSFSLRGVGAFR